MTMSSTAFAPDAQALLRQAQEFRDQGNLPAAAVKQRDAVEVLGEGPDWDAWRDAHLDLIYDLYVLKHNEEALAEIDVLLKEARQRSDLWGEAKALRYRGDIRAEVRALSEAEVAYEQSLTAARQGRFRGLEADTLLSWGDLRRLQTRYDDGRQDFDRAAALFDAENLATMAAAARLHIGSLEVERGRPHAAEPLLRQILAAESAADSLTKAHAGLCLGKIERDRKVVVAAREHFSAADQAYRSLGDLLGQANVAYNLGVLELSEGNAEAAKRQFNDAEILYRRVGDKVREADAKTRRKEAEKAIKRGPKEVAQPVSAPASTPAVLRPPPIQVKKTWLDALRKFFEDKTSEIIGIAIGTLVVGLLTILWNK